jgi:phosphohistidine swiveling domain-containing protein
MANERNHSMTETTELGNLKPSVEFSTKAETLINLKKHLLTADILPLYFFTVANWLNQKEKIIAELASLPWFNKRLVVRSSATSEDTKESSLAGLFTSIVGVKGKIEVIDAIDTVIQSYPLNETDHQILIQPYLENVKIFGVAFGHDPNTNGPYLVINYDDYSHSTESITSGKCKSSKCFIWHRACQVMPRGFLEKIILLINELEELFQTNLLDIEFAITEDNEIFLFQARPLIIKASEFVAKQTHQKIIARIANKISMNSKQHPYLFGKQSIYGVMPDWNPAEIIGVRPRPLSLSLYRLLVTDSVWAYQRDNYGYNNLRSFPLLLDFEGLPYIDVRVSFNSFLPKGLPEELAERLVNYYIDRLIEAPELHDKVEFEIIFSSYTLDLKDRLTKLIGYGFTIDDCQTIANSLIYLTNKIINNRDGLWKKDLEKIYDLQKRQDLLFDSQLDPISKMYWILEDCKRYGTLPFAGLARAGFIAVQLLKSFMAIGIINQEEYAKFFSSLDTISSKINHDFTHVSREIFLRKYGHLRPGTYDILSARYDETPDSYFDYNHMCTPNHKPDIKSFSLSINQLRAIQHKTDADGLQINVLELLEFIKTAIESREYSKFIFTRSVSEFLKLLGEYANQQGFSTEDCSYLDAHVIETLYGSSTDPHEIILHSIALGKERYAVTKTINLPPLICTADEAWQFHFPETLPNFITQKTCIGPVTFAHFSKELLAHSILFIPSADPGYDWIFSHSIAGFVTQFGGINSHMAIRAGELGIPAVIGVGETNYQHWSKAKKLQIDSINKQVHIL